MAKIVIINDNRSTGVLLKRELEREDHEVYLITNWRRLSADTVDPTIDLVLIHQIGREDFGWKAFNQFKSTHQDTPTMLCAMPDYNWTSMDWIVKAVHEALTHMNKLDVPTALWTWDTGFNDTVIDHNTP